MVEGPPEPLDDAGQLRSIFLERRDHARLAALQVPVVIVDPVGQPDPRIPSIGATNWAGGLMATEHLIEIGHRRIGTITGRPSLLCSQARLDGYRAALEREGIPADPALVYSGDFHFEAALVAATDMLKLDDPTTAIFAGSDMQAMGVYEAARLHRRRCQCDQRHIGGGRPCLGRVDVRRQCGRRQGRGQQPGEQNHPAVIS